MDGLSPRPGEGDHIEIQSGIAPTQNRRPELAPQSEMHWTEVYGALEVDPHAAHDPGLLLRGLSLRQGARSMPVFPQQNSTGSMPGLTEVSRRPMTRRHSEGSAWGRRHERLTGRPLAPGLYFAVSAAPRSLDDFTSTGDRRKPGGTVPPRSRFDPGRVRCERKRRTAERDLLHALLIGIAALDRGPRDGRGLLRSLGVAPGRPGLACAKGHWWRLTPIWRKQIIWRPGQPAKRRRHSQRKSSPSSSATTGSRRSMPSAASIRR